MPQQARGEGFSDSEAGPRDGRTDSERVRRAGMQPLCGRSHTQARTGVYQTGPAVLDLEKRQAFLRRGSNLDASGTHPCPGDRVSIHTSALPHLIAVCSYGATQCTDGQSAPLVGAMQTKKGRCSIGPAQLKHATLNCAHGISTLRVLCAYGSCAWQMCNDIIQGRSTISRTMREIGRERSPARCAAVIGI